MSAENSAENKFLFDKTTEKLQQFQKYYEEENRYRGDWDSGSNFLVRYIVQYKLSPFVNDGNLEKAGNFLREHGVHKEII